MNLEKIHLILFLKPYSNWTAFNTVKADMKFHKSESFKPYSTGFLKCSNWSHK